MNAGIRGLQHLIVLLGALAATLTCAQEQEFPTKSIRIVVAMAPGGGGDLNARRLAERLTRILKQNVIVENIAGGGGNSGAVAVVRAAPDGHTLFFASHPILAINPLLYDSLPFDADRDFAPVVLVSENPHILLVNPALPANRLSDLIAVAKARPGAISYASGGTGSGPHLATELLKLLAGIDLTHVPYKGSGPALVAAMAGEVQLIIEPIISAKAYVSAEKLRALAVTSDQRSSAVPELPTAAENGLPGYEASYWLGVHAPAGTPKDIIAKLSTTIAAILRNANVRTQLAAQGVEPIGNNPVEFAARITSDIEKWGKVIRDAGVPPE